MPYKIVHEDDQVCVVKVDGGEKIHCYKGANAERKAKRLLAALYANVEDADENENKTAVKAVSEDAAGIVVGGYIVLWGTPETKDLQGDYFTPETELMLEHYRSVPCLFHHGLDSSVGLSVIGKRVSARTDDVGVFVSDWIDKSNRYWRMVEPLLSMGRLYYSPGSAPHLVKRALDGRLLSFPIVEDTLTPIPAQYRLRPVEQIKAAYKVADIELPQAIDAAASAGALDADVLKAAIEIEELFLNLMEESDERK